MSEKIVRSNRKTCIKRKLHPKKKRSKLFKKTLKRNKRSKLKRTLKRRNSFKRNRRRTMINRGGTLSEQEGDIPPNPHQCERITKIIKSLIYEYNSYNKKVFINEYIKVVKFYLEEYIKARGILYINDIRCKFSHFGKIWRYVIKLTGQNCPKRFNRDISTWKKNGSVMENGIEIKELLDNYEIEVSPPNHPPMYEKMYFKEKVQRRNSKTKTGHGVVVSKLEDSLTGKMVDLVLVSYPIIRDIDYLNLTDKLDIKSNSIVPIFIKDEELKINYILSDCRTEIQKNLEGNVKKQMIILPSQLNGAEHPNNLRGGIPLYEINNRDVSNLMIYTQGGHRLPNWLYKYIHDRTGGPIGQLSGSLEVAQEVVRISEADTLGRRYKDLKEPLPINYVREIIKSLPKKGRIKLVNGYLNCQRADRETAELFVENMSKMKILMSVNNPTTGLHNGMQRFQSEKVIDMVYASAIPIRDSEYDSKINVETDLIGINVIFNQYLLSLLQAYELAKDLNSDEKYQVLAMPLGSGVFKNPPIFVLFGLREAIRVLYILHSDAKDKLDIRLLLFNGKSEDIIFKNDLLKNKLKHEDYITKII